MKKIYQLLALLLIPITAWAALPTRIGNGLVVGPYVYPSIANQDLGSSTLKWDLWVNEINGSPFSAISLPSGGSAADYLRGDNTWQNLSPAARAALSATAPLAYNSGTGAFSIPAGSSVQDGYLSTSVYNIFNAKEPAISAGTSAQYWRGDKTFQTLNTSAVPESGNLYYTDSRARSAISATAPVAYDNSTGVVSMPAGSSTQNGYVSTSAQGVAGEKTFENALGIKELASTPATPSSGYQKIYAKNDGKVYRLKSTGTETELGAGGGSGEGAKNYVINPGAETDASTSVTATNTTVSRNTTSPLYETADFSFTIDSATDVVEWALNTFDVELKNQVCEVGGTFTIDANGENVQVQLYRNSVAVGSKNLWTTGTSQPQEFGIYAPCGDLTNATTLRVVGTAATSSSVKIDHLQVTKMRGISRSQVGGTWLGSVSRAASSGCSPTNNVVAWTDFPTNASCAAWIASAGSTVQAIGTTKIGFTIPDADPNSIYTIYVTSLGKYGGSGTTQYRFSDGTDSSNPVNIFKNDTTEWGGFTSKFTLRPTSTGSKTYYLQNFAMSASAGLGIIYNGTNDGPMTIVVEKMPIDSAVLTAAAKSGDYDWVRYYPTFTGFGTVDPANVEMYHRRVGGVLEIKGSFVSGTATATGARVSLPPGLVSATLAAFPQKVGGWTQSVPLAGNGHVLIGNAVSYLTFGYETGAIAGLTEADGNGIIANGTRMSINASVAINGWTKSATSASITGEPGVWYGAHGSDCSWSRSSSTPGDASGDSSCTFTEIYNRNFGTVSSLTDGSGKIMGLSLTPKLTGDYELCYSMPMGNSTTGYSLARLVDGSGAKLGGENVVYTTSNQSVSGTSACVPFSTQAGTAKSLKLYTWAGGGTVSVGAFGIDAISWTIKPVTQNLPGLFGSGSALREPTRVDCRQSAGAGSTNTKVRRYTTCNTTGTDITVSSDSSTLGRDFTINTTGIYTLNMGDFYPSGNEWVAASVNGNALTTAAHSITTANGLIGGVTYASGQGLTNTVTGYFTGGQVIRVQCATCASVADDRVTVSIVGPY